MSDFGPVATVTDIGGTAVNFQQGAIWEVDNTEFVWFDPIALLRDLVGPDDPRYQYWCQACASQLSPELLNLTTVRSQPAPYFGCLDEISNAASQPQCGCDGSLCFRFMEWMFSSFWALATGGVEQSGCNGGMG